MSQSLHIAPSRKLKITILTVGSRGDLQPYCALAIGLKRAGHEVTVATHENFKPFVRKFDLKFAAIAGNMQEFLQSKQGQRLIAGEKLKKEEGDKLLLQQLESGWQACQGSEVIIYTPLATFGYHIAEKLGVSCFFASVLPLTPTGMFGIILSGWGDVGRTVNVKDSLRVFVIKEVPHDWLFPQVPAVVHHGGASTTAAVLRAGTPSVTVPFFADQPVWGEKLTRLGVSPAPIPYKKVSEKTLAAAIEVVLGDEVMRCKAQELGQKIRDEDGVANAVEAFHRHLGLIG